MSLAPTSSFYQTTGAAPATADPASRMSAEASPLGLFDALLQQVTGTNRGEGLPTDITALVDRLTDATPGEDSEIGGIFTDLLQQAGVAELDPALQPQAMALLDGLSAALGVPMPLARLAEAAAPALTDMAASALDALRKTDGGDAPPDHSPQLKELADKLLKLAQSLETATPGLAERLAALGGKLASGETDLTTLAALLKADAPASRLDPGLMAVPPVTAAAKLFGDVSLSVPTAIAATGGDTAPVHAGSNATADNGKGDSPPDGMAARAGALRVDGANAAQTPAAADSQPPASHTAISPGSATAPTVSADAKIAHSAYAAPVRQINVPQIAVEIVRQVQAGNSRFQIRLDPPELGRIDVKLDMDAKGNVNARMTVDRAETLDLMQRDQRALERALAQAGLDSARTSLEFSLRHNPSGQQGQQQQHAAGRDRAPLLGTADPDAAPGAAPLVTAYRGTASPGGVNLFV